MWPLRPIRILSLDGGGIRGLIPALVLKELSDRMRRYGREKPLHRCFDLIAGTSTGGLIALALSLPQSGTRTPALSIEDIVRMYREDGTKIFPPWKFSTLHSVAHAFREKYDIENFDSFLGPTFADITLQDALTDLLITSFDVERNTPFFFKRRRGRDDDTNFLMSDVAKATAAAPTYFDPAIIHEAENPARSYCMVDGAVYANNPAMVGYIEGLKLYGRMRRFQIISLGTGRASRERTRDDISSWGFFDWISPMRGAPLFGIISAGQAESVDYQLTKLSGVEYLRINGFFDGPRPDIDDASEENIARLSETAARIISNYDNALEKLARTL